MAGIQNKKAFFHYDIQDRFVAGISLQGAEVKSLRFLSGNLEGAFISLKGGEVFLKNFHISPWKFSQELLDPVRDRKLLLRKREILRLQGKIDEKGYTIIPLAVFFKNGYAKVEIALAKGKKKYDKRHDIKKREETRRLERKIKLFSS